MLSRLQRAVHVLEDSLLVAMMLAMITVAVAQILLRNSSIGGILWGDAFLRVLVLWLGMMGAIVASRKRQHISIELVGHYVPSSVRHYVQPLTAVFTAVVCGLLVWHTWEFVVIEREAASMAFAQVPVWMCEAILPVGFFLIGVRYALYALLELTGREVEE